MSLWLLRIAGHIIHLFCGPPHNNNSLLVAWGAHGDLAVTDVVVKESLVEQLTLIFSEGDNELFDTLKWNQLSKKETSLDETVKRLLREYLDLKTELYTRYIKDNFTF